MLILGSCATLGVQQRTASQGHRPYPSPPCQVPVPWWVGPMKPPRRDITSPPQPHRKLLHLHGGLTATLSTPSPISWALPVLDSPPRPPLLSWVHTVPSQRPGPPWHCAPCPYIQSQTTSALGAPDQSPAAACPHSPQHLVSRPGAQSLAPLCISYPGAWVPFLGTV